MGGGIEFNNKKYPVFPPSKLSELEFDEIFIGLFRCYQDEVIEFLQPYKEKINLSYTNIEEYARINFLRELAMFQGNLKGACAELGVFRGDTAKFINEFFDTTLYLLDTFEGFSQKDMEKEEQFSTSKVGDFSDTSLDLVKSKMPYLQKCRFIKGYFPQSATDELKNEKFRFVNIDVDLYQPILEGCEFFYPRLVKGGIMLIHDYLHPFYTGTKKAVDEFAFKYDLKFYPIGDATSVFFIKE